MRLWISRKNGRAPFLSPLPNMDNMISDREVACLIPKTFIQPEHSPVTTLITLRNARKSFSEINDRCPARYARDGQADPDPLAPGLFAKDVTGCKGSARTNQESAGLGLG